MDSGLSVKQKNNKGLTLIELIIALSLSIVILVILFSAMNLSYKSQNRGAEKAEATQKIRIVSDRIAWLLRGAYPYIMKQTADHKLYFEGESDSIGFTTTSVDAYGTGPEDRAGLKWVSIYTDNNSLKIREKVFFLEDVFDSSGGKEYVLLSGVSGLQIEYLDVPEDDQTESEWVSDWDPDEMEYLPAAVKINFFLEHEGKTIAVPEIIVHIHARKKETF